MGADAGVAGGAGGERIVTVFQRVRPFGQIGQQRGEVRAGQRARQGLHGDRVFAESFDVDAEPGQLVSHRGDLLHRGHGQLDDVRHEQRLDGLCPVPQALVVDPLVRGVLVDQHQPARPFADEVGAVELAEIAQAVEVARPRHELRLRLVHRGLLGDDVRRRVGPCRRG